MWWCRLQTPESREKAGYDEPWLALVAATTKCNLEHGPQRADATAGGDVAEEKEKENAATRSRLAGVVAVELPNLPKK